MSNRNDRCWYNLNGWMVWYEANNGLKSVIPVAPGIYVYDDFLQVPGTDLASSTTWEITTTADGGSAAVAAGESAGEHGIARLTSDTGDNEGIVLYLPQPIYPAYNPVVECKFRINSASSSKMAFGFADVTAVTSAANLGTYVGATPAVGGDNGALFIWDTDATNDYLYFVSQRAAGAEQSGTAYAGALVADTAYYLRVGLVDNNNTITAYFWLNGEQVGTLTNAVDGSVALYPAISVATATSGTAKHIEVDYLRIWARRA